MYATLLVAVAALLHAMLAPAQAAALPLQPDYGTHQAESPAGARSPVASSVARSDDGASGQHGQHGHGKAHAVVTGASGKARAGGPAPLPPVLAVAAPQLAPVPGRCGVRAGAVAGVPDWSSPRTVVLRC
ncbi:hypothetical protein [Streptomyces boninensis]|uniref:hypothetical protein n=1 Tax=Streptomyces boninensis TaxID=2039455 RepID=UPI003B21E80D